MALFFTIMYTKGNFQMLAFMLLVLVGGMVLGAAGMYTVERINESRKVSVLAVDDEETLYALKDKVGKDTVVVRSHPDIKQTEINVK